MDNPDVGICQKVTPPVVVPISERAIAKLDLPVGVDCCIFLEAHPFDVLSLFPDDWVVVAMPEFEPQCIAVAELIRYSS